jgi:hypothetical protein
MSLSTLGRPAPCRVVNRVASCILILAPSDAVSDGIDPSRVSDHALRGHYQIQLFNWMLARNILQGAAAGIPIPTARGRVFEAQTGLICAQTGRILQFDFGAAKRGP